MKKHYLSAARCRASLGLLLLAVPLAGRAQSAGTWQTAITHEAASTTMQSIITAAAPDAGGGVVVLGTFISTLKLGTITLTNSTTTPHMFVARLNAAGQWTQAVAATSFTAGSVTPNALAVDAAGTVTAVGSFQGTLPLGTTTLTSTGNEDVFVARLSAAGQWTQTAQGTGSNIDRATGVALAPDGTATIVGTTYSGNTTFGTLSAATSTPTFNSTADVYLARLNATGQWTQAVRLPGSGAELSRRVTVDAAGTATLAGTYDVGIVLGSTTLTNPGGTAENIFVGRYSAAGLWTLALRADAHSADGLAADANGGVVLAGTFFNAAAFGTQTLSTPSANDVYVARLNAAGQWTQAVRGAATNRNVLINDLAVDATGQATLVGSFMTTAQFGSTTLTNNNPLPGRPEAFAAQLSPGGAWLTAQQSTSANLQQSRQANALAVAIPPGGTTATVCGSFQSNVKFGSTTLTAANTGLFVARLTSAGALATTAPTALTSQTQLFPNPTTGLATLELAGLREQGPVALEVLNVLGQSVQQHRVSPKQGQLTDQLNLAALPTGVYTVRIHAQEGTVVKRLVKE